MSDVFGQAMGEYNPAKENCEWEPKLKVGYPTLARALREQSKGLGDSADMPAMTLMIFAREGKLKFSLSSQEWPRTYYGVISDAGDVLGSVERALAANEGEWSKKKNSGLANGKF